GTRVRWSPRPRRSIVAAPVAPLDTFDPWAAKACGSELIKSSVRVVPSSLISWLDSTVTGLADVKFGCGMRVPVMTMSCADLTGAPCALVDGTGVASCGAVVVGCVLAAPAVSDGFAGGGVVCAKAGEASVLAP